MHTEDITEVCRYSILALFLLAFSGASLAADHYVWCGASGGKTGTDFTNAYTDLPLSLTRGDTYYVAGSASCSYRAHTFSDDVSGTKVISILHATAAANSGITGWQSGFGTTPARWITTQVYGGGGQVAIWVFKRSFYSLDGEFGTIGATGPTTGTFGFYLHRAGDKVNSIYLDGIANAGPLRGMTFNRTEVDGSPMDWNNLVGGSFALQSVAAIGQHGTDGLTITNSYWHDMESGLIHVHAPTNLTADHNWFARIMYSTTVHANGASINPFDGGAASPNLIFSNDTWEDVCGTSAITVMTGIISNLLIYGNTFFQTTQNIIFPGATAVVGCVGDGQIGDLGVGDGSSNTSGGLVISAAIYNNTFYNGSTGGSGGIQFTNTNSTNIVQSNNLFVNNQNTYVTVGCIGCSEDHNTTINSKLGFLFSCTGIGDSCQGTSNAITSASVTSNVADVHIASGHGLSIGSPVLVLGSNITNTTPCGIDTYYPYPTVSQVVSKREFKYTVQRAVPNAICQAGYGVLFPSPAAPPFSSPSTKTFTLSGEKVRAHLNDGMPLLSPYNIDPLGVTRGADGTWERGAFEFVGGGGLADQPTHLPVPQ